MGPKRYTDIPCQISDIKLLDAVVISHNHYDHLSLPTVLKIRELHPNVHFFVPLRNKDWFISAGLNNVMELDWWDSREFTMSGSSAERQSSTNAPTVEQSGVKETEGPRPPQEISAVIKCLPCQHTSARTPFDKSHTLWASWSIESGDQKVWFGGYVNALPC